MRVCFVIDMCFAQHHTPENAHFNSVQQWGEKVFIRFRACTRTQRQTPLLWRSAQVSPAKQVIRDGVASAAACYTRLRIPHRLSSCQPSASDRTAGAAWMRFRRPRARCCERSHVPFAASAPVPKLRTLVAFHRLERAAPLMTTSSLWVAAWASRFDVGPASSIRIAIVEDRVAMRCTAIMSRTARSRRIPRRL